MCRKSVLNDLNGPLSAELKIAYVAVVWRLSGEYRMKVPGSRRSTLIKWENVNQREVTDADAAGFPSFCSSGDDGGNVRHSADLGTNAFGDRTGRQRKAQRCIGTQLFRDVDSSCLSLVRAARIGAWPDQELVALGGAGPRGPGRLAGFASQQGRDQQL